MKKTMAFLLSAVMVLSLTACSGGSKGDPKQIYTDAMTKTAALKAQQMDIDMDIDMDMGDLSMGMKMKMGAQVKMDGDKPEMALEVSTSMLGEEMKLNYYYKENYLYLNAMGETAKVAMDADEAMGETGVTTNTMNAVDIMDKFEMTETEDGNYQFDYTIKDAAMKQTLAQALAQQEDMGNLFEGDVNFKAMSGTAVVSKDGYFLSDKMTMEFDMSMDGQSMSVTMVLDAKYKDPGKDFTITYPADLDSYPEADLAL